MSELEKHVAENMRQLRQQSDVTPELGSELQMANRLADGDLRDFLRYVPDGPSHGWHRWDDSHWVPSPDPIPRPLAIAVHCAAAESLRRGIDLRSARYMESTASMRAVLAQLQAHDSMRFDVDQLNPPYLLATPDGLLNLRTGEVMPATPAGPAFLLSTAVTYDPKAQHPLWTDVEQHVASLTDGAVVKRFIGASLNGIPPDRKMLFLVGKGGDGKSTLLRSCYAALGGFGGLLMADAVSGDARGAHGHEILSPLSTARFIYSAEVPADLDWDLLKAVSGGESRGAKRLYSRVTTVQMRAWLAFATNTPPIVREQAVADRCIIVRWEKPADPNPEIVSLIATPGEERAAFLRACLRWMVEGNFEYLRDGLGVPDYARPEVEPEGLAGWWAESVAAGVLVRGPGRTPLAPLANHAAQWLRAHGYTEPTITALGIFLGSRVGRKREMLDGRKISLYGVHLDVVGRG